MSQRRQLKLPLVCGSSRDQGGSEPAEWASPVVAVGAPAAPARDGKVTEFTSPEGGAVSQRLRCFSVLFATRNVVSVGCPVVIRLGRPNSGKLENRNLRGVAGTCRNLPGVAATTPVWGEFSSKMVTGGGAL